MVWLDKQIPYFSSWPSKSKFLWFFSDSLCNLFQPENKEKSGMNRIVQKLAPAQFSKLSMFQEFKAKNHIVHLFKLFKAKILQKIGFVKMKELIFYLDILTCWEKSFMNKFFVL